MRSVAAAACALALAATAWPALAAGSLGERIRSEVRALGVEAGVSPDSLEIPRLTGFDVESLDPARAEIRVSANPRNAWRGSVPVTVAVWADGRERRRGVVTVRVADRRVAWVASRDLERGAALDARDLRAEEVDARDLPGDAIADPADALGLVTRRDVVEGSVMRARWLAREPRVERGALVMIRLQRGPLRIEGRGRVREAGDVGDWVRVQNIDSRRELVGRIAPDGAIDVDF
ncbi:MAG: flagellar basal body P-ring formation chaperone FlgA [Myxococcota bacterium]